MDTKTIRPLEATCRVTLSANLSENTRVSRAFVVFVVKSLPNLIQMAFQILVWIDFQRRDSVAAVVELYHFRRVDWSLTKFQ
jgi:hypothetical protein